MKYLYYVLILVFIYFIAVQYNDPDPMIWMLLYAVPLYLVVEKLIKKRLDTKYCLIIALIYFLWACNQFPPEWEGVMLNKMGMKTMNIEQGRESLGLAFSAIVIALLGLNTKSK